MTNYDEGGPMKDSSAGRRGLGARARLFTLSALAAVAGLAALAGAAQAEQLKFTFTDGRANLGSQKGVHMIDPGAGDPPATLTLNYNPATDAFNAPASGLVFPSKTLENIEALPEFFIDARADFAAISSIAGSYDDTTGELDTTLLDVKATISIYPAGAEQTDANLFERCSVSPVPLPIDSTGEIVDDTDDENPITYAAAPFMPSPGPGAGVATWEELPPSVGGPLCGSVDDLLEGPGGIWLSGATPTVGPDPVVTPPPPGGGGTAGVVKTKKCKKGFKKVKGKCKKAKKKKK
jgi:hypothetical protein